MSCCAVLCCAVLCCGAVWCALLRCAVVWCGVLWCAAVCCVACCAVVRCCRDYEFGDVCKSVSDFLVDIYQLVWLVTLAYVVYKTNGAWSRLKVGHSPAPAPGQEPEPEQASCLLLDSEPPAGLWLATGSPVARLLTRPCCVLRCVLCAYMNETGHLWVCAACGSRS